MAKRPTASRRRRTTRPASHSSQKQIAALERAVETYREHTRTLSERLVDVNFELNRLRERHRLLFESAPVGYLALDRRGVIVDLNETAAGLLGQKRDLIVDKPFITFLHAVDMRHLAAHLGRAAVGDAATEFRLRSDDDEFRVVHVISRKAPTETVIYNTVIADSADKYRAVRATESRYRTIVETAAEGICTINARGVVTFVNKRLCSMLGYSTNELVGQSARSLVPPDELKQLLASTRTSAVPLPAHRELELQRRDGSRFWASLSLSTLRDERGNLDGLLGMYSDITPRRQLAETRDYLVRQLVAAQETERQRIALELHDQMGQHIVALSLGLAQLRSSCQLADGAAEVLARLQVVSEQLSRDVHHLALELRPSALDHLGLGVAIANYADDVARRSGIEIDVHYSDHPAGRLDPAVETTVYRIVQEALTNVVRHSVARHASIVIEPRGQAVQVIVEDNGVGFDVEQLGSGAHQRLGVAGMRERATLIGARLQIESRRGHGTTIFLTVPLAVKEGKHEETAVIAR